MERQKPKLEYREKMTLARNRRLAGKHDELILKVLEGMADIKWGREEYGLRRYVSNSNSRDGDQLVAVWEAGRQYASYDDSLSIPDAIITNLDFPDFDNLKHIERESFLVEMRQTQEGDLYLAVPGSSDGLEEKRLRLGSAKNNLATNLMYAFANGPGRVRIVPDGKSNF